MSIRVLIADDHGLLRAGLRTLLNAEPAIKVVAEASDGYEALRKVKTTNPDVILMDISMPGQCGIETARKLKQIKPGVHILILTVHEDKSLLREAIQAGASGYIVKRAVESELINAIHAVSHGDMYVHPAMTRFILHETTHKRPEPKQPLEPLTNREIDVMRLIVHGYTNRQIAELLNLSRRTVESHRANIMGKLQVNSRVELMRYAEESGFLEWKEKETKVGVWPAPASSSSR